MRTRQRSRPGLIGWFVCAFFASVAYNWTFYYLLALIVATRDVVRGRLALAAQEQRPRPGTSLAPVSGAD